VEALVMSKEMIVSGTTLPSPGVAAVLSFFIPGLGQFYNGKFLRGIFWLIVTPGLWIFSAGILGWICHLLSAYTAYSYAKDMR
jgi:TM2 domain-containing membrane protein YozV